MKRDDDITLLVDRARKEPPPVDRERRHIYGGDPQERIAGYAVRPNRKAVRRTRSTFNLIIAIFGAGAAIVLYISNTLAVNRLAQEVADLQREYDRLVSANQVLRAEVDRKSSLERIGTIAAERLGLVHATEHPIPFTVDEDREASLSAP